MGEKIVYRSVDTLFNNSQCLFIEFHDILAMPWFVMLTFLKYNERLASIFDIEELTYYDERGLLEWYVYRKERNIFKNFRLREGIQDTKSFDYDKFLSSCTSAAKEFYEIPSDLKFMEVLKILLGDKSIVKSIIIYTEYNEPPVAEFVEDRFGIYDGKVKYFHGKFKDMLSLIPNDSTYVLSDIEKVNDLVETGKIKMSSIIIPSGLRYNYEYNNAEKLKVDMEKLSEQYLFKYNFFDNYDMEDPYEDDEMASAFKVLIDPDMA